MILDENQLTFGAILVSYKQHVVHGDRSEGVD